MSLQKAISGAVNSHKLVAKDLIYASEKQITIMTAQSAQHVSSGASMFADLRDTKSYDPYGPFPCIWIDADAVRANDNSREFALVRSQLDAEVVIKLWLEDVLLDATAPYGETYLDTANHVEAEDGKRFEILDYDRYGLGTTNPYMIAVVLRGSFSSE